MEFLKPIMTFLMNVGDNLFFKVNIKKPVLGFFRCGLPNYLL